MEIELKPRHISIDTNNFFKFDKKRNWERKKREKNENSVISPLQSQSSCTAFTPQTPHSPSSKIKNYSFSPFFQLNRKFSVDSQVSTQPPTVSTITDISRNSNLFYKTDIGSCFSTSDTMSSLSSANNSGSEYQKRRKKSKFPIQSLLVRPSRDFGDGRLLRGKKLRRKSTGSSLTRSDSIKRVCGRRKSEMDKKGFVVARNRRKLSVSLFFKVLYDVFTWKKRKKKRKRKKRERNV